MTYYVLSEMLSPYQTLTKAITPAMTAMPHLILLLFIHTTMYNRGSQFSQTGTQFSTTVNIAVDDPVNAVNLATETGSSNLC